MKKIITAQTFKDIKRNRSLYLFVAPYMLIFFAFMLLPVIISIFYSFTYFNILEPPKFVGLDNYLRLFLDDEVFLTSVRNTFILAVISGPLSYILCLIFAWFINELPPKIRSLVTLVFYAPSISGNIYLMWKIIFAGDSYGYANGILLKLGLIDSPITWLQNPKYMMMIIIVVVLWSSLGVSFLSFIAGFQGVDKTQFEAAAVDGITNRWQELWYITLPNIKAQLMFGAVMNISSAYGIGSVTKELCGFPSRDYAVHTVVNHLEDYGVTRFEMGYACAIASILFLMMFGTNLLVRRLLRKVGT